MILSGKRVGTQELEDSHVIVKACENAEELQKDALKFAKTFQKKRMHKNIIEVIEIEDTKIIESLAIYIKE